MIGNTRANDLDWFVGGPSTLRSFVIQNWSQHPNHFDQVPLGPRYGANVFVGRRGFIAKPIGLPEVVPDLSHLSLQLAGRDSLSRLGAAQDSSGTVSA
jgi:hypothetical protein